MLARRLAAGGVNLGWRVGKNFESRFFLRRNEWLLRRCGGSWEYPEPSRMLIEDAALMRSAADRFRRDVHGLGFREHLGFGRRGAEVVWKDPRNLFTFDIWDRVFEGLRAVVLVRHGIDAAASLYERARRNMVGGAHSHAFARTSLRDRAISASTGYDPFVFASIRCQTLEGAFEVWCEYAQRVSELLDLQRDRAMLVRYEDVLAAPMETIERIIEFGSLTEFRGRGAGELEPIRADRAFAFADDPELSNFALQVQYHPLLRRFGYGASGRAIAPYGDLVDGE
jgi:hypothetical protein